MSFWRQAALLFLVGVLIALALVWRDDPGSQGTSGQFEFRDPTCAEVPVLCTTPVVKDD